MIVVNVVKKAGLVVSVNVVIVVVVSVVKMTGSVVVFNVTKMTG